MNKLIPAVVATLVAGCAHTPQQVMETGHRVDRISFNPPEQVATCIARNSDNFTINNLSAGLHANERHGTTPGTKEVVVEVNNGTWSVARISPAESGSRVAFWMTPGVRVAYHEPYVSSAMAGC